MNQKTQNVSNTNGFATKLVCVNYPGIVNNVDKMIQSLGGMNKIESNISNKRKMLELKFRPEDEYCKPAISDLDKKPGVLIKLTPKDPTKPQNKQEFNHEVLGVTALTYTFNRLCDFQYLPLITTEEENSNTPLTYIYNQIVPENIPEKGWLFDNESDDMPFYLPPAIFSRFDNPQNRLYFDRSKFYEGRFKPEYAEMLRQQELERKNSRSIDQKVIAKKSGHGGLFSSFYDPNIPSGPPKLAMQFLNLRYTNKGAYEKIKSLFEERPIWSRAAILYTSEVPKEQLKFILPAVAYHLHNGPWRIMWCRYGYDPRKDPSSRIYQTFDFRVRATAGLKAKVRTKRQYNSQRYISKSPTNLDKLSLNQVIESEDEEVSVGDSTFILKPGTIPPARQMFYQYCDVHLPEIQSMLNRLPPVIPSATCDYKNGWLPNKFTEQCREIANKYIIEYVQKSVQEHRHQGEPGENDPGPSTSNTGEEKKSQEFLEISDSDSEDSDFAASDLSDDEDDFAETQNEAEGIGQKVENDNDEADDDAEIDIEAVNDVNKLLQENYDSLKDFDRLVCDSD